MAKIPKKLYAFRLSETAFLSLLKLSVKWSCSQAEAIERSLKMAENQEEEFAVALSPVASGNFSIDVIPPSRKDWRANRRPLPKPKDARK